MYALLIILFAGGTDGNNPSTNLLFDARGEPGGLYGEALARYDHPGFIARLLDVRLTARYRDPAYRAEYAAFAVRCRGVRRLGSAVLDLAWVAAGRLDGFWELRLGSWDVAAGSLFVEEAGGRVTNLVGGALDLNAPAVVASNGRIHEAMLTLLRQTRQA
jgi:fructose-1,6-bisphosphatase/inositol monophosphatase family enzyme